MINKDIKVGDFVYEGDTWANGEYEISIARVIDFDVSEEEKSYGCNVHLEIIDSNDERVIGARASTSTDYLFKTKNEALDYIKERLLEYKMQVEESLRNLEKEYEVSEA